MKIHLPVLTVTTDFLVGVTPNHPSAANPDSATAVSGNLRILNDTASKRLSLLMTTPSTALRFRAKHGTNGTETLLPKSRREK
jgi:hypothetical protein